mmetsp:Transcript_5264/g.16553  ORF Transcript_5264/g.16553 Transcript_5264/m.16553 type:complete len:342 (+) Transcript_5264:64-1089(+)
MTREERRRRGFSHYNQNYERDDRRESEVRSSENERRRCSRLGCVGPAAAVIALGGEVLGPAAGPVVAFGLRGPSLGGGFVFEDFGDVAGGGAEVPLVVALFGAAGRADAEADGDGEEAGAGQERHEAQQIKRGVAAWHDGVVSGRGLGGSPRGGGRRRLGRRGPNRVPAGAGVRPGQRGGEDGADAVDLDRVLPDVGQHLARAVRQREAQHEGREHDRQDLVREEPRLVAKGPREGVPHLRRVTPPAPLVRKAPRVFGHAPHRLLERLRPVHLRQQLLVALRVLFAALVPLLRTPGLLLLLLLPELLLPRLLRRLALSPVVRRGRTLLLLQMRRRPLGRPR